MECHRFTTCNSHSDSMKKHVMVCWWRLTESLSAYLLLVTLDKRISWNSSSVTLWVFLVLNHGKVHSGVFLSSEVMKGCASQAILHLWQRVLEKPEKPGKIYHIKQIFLITFSLLFSKFWHVCVNILQNSDVKCTKCNKWSGCRNSERIRGDRGGPSTWSAYPHLELVESCSVT